MRQDTIMVALVKGRREGFGFIFTADRRDEICETIARFVADPELAFTWYDASVLGEQIQEQELDARNRWEMEEN